MKATDFYRIKLVVEPSNDSITLDDIYNVFSKFGNLLDMKDGSGKLAYDGHGFDLDTNAYEFFFYFKDSASGLRQLRSAHSLLVKAAKKIEAKKCKVSILADENTSSALSHRFKNSTRSNGTDSIQGKLNIVEHSIQSAIQNVDASLDTLEQSQDPRSAIGELDTSLDTLVESCNSALDTFRDITQQIERSTQFADSQITQQLQHIQSVVKNSEEIASTTVLNITNFDDESFPYKLITRLANPAYLKRLFRLFYASCKKERRSLTKDERSLLEFSILMIRLSGASTSTYQLVDVYSNDLWKPDNIDPISDDNKGSWIETPLMPYLVGFGGSVENRGLAILKKSKT